MEDKVLYPLKACKTLFRRWPVVLGLSFIFRRYVSSGRMLQTVLFSSIQIFYFLVFIFVATIVVLVISGFFPKWRFLAFLGSATSQSEFLEFPNTRKS